MRQFPIGSRAWAPVYNGFVLNDYDFGDYVKDFLVIGAKGQWRVLLVLPPYSNEKDICTPGLCETYHIDHCYLGQKIVYFQDWKLRFRGRQCGRCESRFDYLAPENYFICWKCELQ